MEAYGLRVEIWIFSRFLGLCGGEVLTGAVARRETIYFVDDGSLAPTLGRSRKERGVVVVCAFCATSSGAR